MIVLLVHYMSAFDWMWQMIHCKSFNQLSARCHSFSWLFFFTFLAGSTETSATFWSNTVLSIKMVMKLIWAAAFCELGKSSGLVGDFKANFSSVFFYGDFDSSPKFVIRKIWSAIRRCFCLNNTFLISRIPKTIYKNHLQKNTIKLFVFYRTNDRDCSARFDCFGCASSGTNCHWHVQCAENRTNTN